MQEDMLLYRTIRDMQLPKLIAEDVPLFNALNSDFFPGIEVAAADYGDFQVRNLAFAVLFWAFVVLFWVCFVLKRFWNSVSAPPAIAFSESFKLTFPNTHHNALTTERAGASDGDRERDGGEEATEGGDHH